MDYTSLDKKEYQDITLLKLDNKHHLPFYIIKLTGDQFRKNLHRHEYVQIEYVSKGSVKHYINDNYFQLVQGDIFVIPPYVPHRFDADQNQESEIIELEFMPQYINEKFSPEENSEAFFDFAYLEPFLVSENKIKPRLNLSGKARDDVEGILNELIGEYKEMDDNFELMFKSFLLRLLILLAREYKKSETDIPAHDVLLDRHKENLIVAKDYIDKNYISDIKAEDAAKIAMMSSSYFRYLFKNLTNMTFTEYVNHLRIKKASDLLVEYYTDSVYDICFSSGFNNINYFNRAFKQQMGLSPTQYRKKVLRIK
ncbi:MAG TPA: AraC family transcriptional regulator [Clostridiales bacterium]|nr:AraC family transcriptional regulator [Clostridiales bacterium]